MTTLKGKKKVGKIKQSRTFFDTRIGEEVCIVEDYVSRGEKVIGWETFLMGTMSVFILYLG